MDERRLIHEELVVAVVVVEIIVGDIGKREIYIQYGERPGLGALPALWPHKSVGPGARSERRIVGSHVFENLLETTGPLRSCTLDCTPG